MARTSWNPEVGPLPKNKGGSHGNVSITNKHIPDAPAEGSASGHGGTKLPWEAGGDCTPKPGDLPPLKSL